MNIANICNIIRESNRYNCIVFKIDRSTQLHVHMTQRFRSNTWTDVRNDAIYFLADKFEEAHPSV